MKLTIVGLNELERELKLLSKAESNQVKRKATRAGARVIRDEIRKRAPENTGVLKRNVVVAGAKGTTDSGIMVRSKGKKGSKQNAFYWRFLELGTSKMAAIPFIRPGYQASEEPASKAAISELNNAIDKVLSK